MKITKTKQAKYTFFRDENTGRLILKNKGEKQSVQISIVKRSILGRIIPEDRSKNEKNLLKNEIRKVVKKWFSNNEYSPYTKSNHWKKDEIYKCLGDLGRKLYCEDENKTKLSDILARYFMGEDVKETIILYRKVLNNAIEHKKEKLNRSIAHNKIPFYWDELKTKLLPASESKMEWLMRFLGKQCFNQALLTQYWKEYGYINIENELNTKMDEFFEKAKNQKQPQSAEKLAGSIYRSVLDYHKELEKQHSLHIEGKEKDNGFKFFVCEVRSYFRQFKQKIIDNKKYNKIGLDIAYIKRSLMEVNVIKHVEDQIRNQLNAGLILYGKFYHYSDKGKIDRSFDSTFLQEIQIEEAFKKQLLTAVAWATTRLNYYYKYLGDDIPGTKSGGDILFDCDYRKIFEDTIMKDQKKYNILLEKLSGAFNLDTTLCPIALLEEIRNSVEWIRNQTYHFNQGSFSQLINDNLEAKKNIQLKEYLRNDISLRQESFLEQIRSMTLANYYSKDLLCTVLSKHHFEFKLYSDRPPFIPSFKKVFDKGCNLYHSGEDHKGLYWYRKDIGAKEMQLAYKNFLQLIYQYCFIPALQDDKETLLNYVNIVKEWNKKEAMNAQGKSDDQVTKFYQFRYENIPSSNNLNLNEYMSNLQRLQSLEESNDLSKGEKQNNYLLFVQDLFVHAFDAFLQSKLSEFADQLIIPQVQNKEDIETTLNTLFEKSNPVLKMHTNLCRENLNDSLIILYPMLRILENPEINRLQHQFIRYRSSFDHKPEDRKRLLDLEELIELVMFTAPVINIVSEEYEPIVRERFQPFIEGNIKGYTDLFYQSNKKTMIMQRSMAIMNRAGVMDLYKKVFTNYKISFNEYSRYARDSNLGEETQDKSSIEINQQQAQTLHKELVKNSHPFNKNKKDEYQKLIDEMNDYNNLRKKVTFASMFEVYKIHTEILGRFIGFSNNWERDIYFLLLALANKKIISLSEEEVINIFTYDSNNSGGILGKIGKLKNKEDAALFSLLYWGEQIQSWEKIKNKIFSRNAIDHLNLITQPNQSGRNQKSIIMMINRVRTLMAYDTKHQHSVSKAIKDIFKKHHFMIKLKLHTDKTNHKGEFMLDKISSEKITHLKNLKRDSFEVEAHNQWMIDSLKSLLHYELNVRTSKNCT